MTTNYYGDADIVAPRDGQQEQRAKIVKEFSLMLDRVPLRAGQVVAWLAVVKDGPFAVMDCAPTVPAPLVGYGWRFVYDKTTDLRL